MRRDACELCGSYHTLSAFPKDVLLGLWISVWLGQSKVDDKDGVRILSVAYHEVVGFEISVDIADIVEVFQPGDDLLCDAKHSKHTELFLATLALIATKVGTDRRVMMPVYR